MGIPHGEPFGGDWIEHGELGVERGQALRRETRDERGPNRRVPWRDGREPRKQRAEIEAAAANDDRAPPTRLDLRDRDPSVARELPRRPRLVRIEKINQMMANPRSLFRGRLRGPDVEAAIGLERVGVYDLAAEPLGELEREVALARRRRPNDREDWRGRRGAAQNPSSRSLTIVSANRFAAFSSASSSRSKYAALETSTG